MAKKKGGKGRRPTPPSQARKSASRPAAAGPSKQPSGASPGAGGDTAKSAASGSGSSRRPAGTAGTAAASGATRVTRAERIEAAQRARRRKSLLTRIGVAVVVVGVVGAIVSLVVSDRRSDQLVIDKLEAGTCRYDTRSDGDAGTGRNHVTDPVFEVNPPSGGDHLANPAGPGIYTAETTPPDGQVVHSQEHGYVILWHKPDLAQDQLDALRTLTSRHSRDVLMVPRPTLPVPVAATAWHKRLLCQHADPTALETFITSYRNKGPEKVPHN